MEVEQKGKNFVQALRGLSSDRGAMAELRRGMNPAMAFRTWPYIQPWCDLESDRQRLICETVAAAFAYHPGAKQRGNIGLTCRELAMEGGRGERGLKTFDATFRRLLSARSRREVCNLMRRVVLAASAKNVSLNHIELYKDLTYWGDSVKVRWAKTYWGGLPKQEIEG